MDPFSQSCIDRLKEADGIRKLIDYLAALPIADWKKQDPDQDGVLALLKAMVDPLRLEMKKDETQGYKDREQRAERVVALHDLIAWVEKKPTSYFHGVNACRVAIQLAARLRRPRIIDQGKCGFCGPTSILVEVVKRTPIRYIQYATDLVQNGKADLWVHSSQCIPIELGATEAIGWDNTDRALPEADFVMLRAMRAKAELLAPKDQDQNIFDIADVPSHATTPGQMAELLVKSGYSNVQNKTVNWYGKNLAHLFDLNTMRKNLDNLIADHAGDPRHRVVMLLINVALADLAALKVKLKLKEISLPVVDHLKMKIPQLKSRWAPTRLTENHWITLRSIQKSGTEVIMKSITWKQRHELVIDADLFCSYYYGYVMGTV